jgi:hypothetical protein
MRPTGVEPVKEIWRTTVLVQSALPMSITLFGRHQLREIVGMRHDQIKPFAQNSGAVFACSGSPCRKRGFGSGDCLLRMLGTHIGYRGDGDTIGRIDDLETRRRIDPFTVHVGL